jgi:hypothetical protein
VAAARGEGVSTGAASVEAGVVVVGGGGTEAVAVADGESELVGAGAAMLEGAVTEVASVVPVIAKFASLVSAYQMA